MGNGILAEMRYLWLIITC